MVYVFFSLLYYILYTVPFYVSLLYPTLCYHVVSMLYLLCAEVNCYMLSGVGNSCHGYVGTICISACRRRGGELHRGDHIHTTVFVHAYAYTRIRAKWKGFLNLDSSPGFWGFEAILGGCARGWRRSPRIGGHLLLWVFPKTQAFVKRLSEPSTAKVSEVWEVLALDLSLTVDAVVTRRRGQAPRKTTVRSIAHVRDPIPMRHIQYTTRMLNSKDDDSCEHGHFQAGRGPVTSQP